MVENDVVPKPGASLVVRIVEAVDHRQPVTLIIREASSDQAPLLGTDPRLTIFDHIARYAGVFHHICEIGFFHLRHPATGVTCSEIFLQQFELFRRGPWAAFRGDQIVMGFQRSFLCRGWLEFIRHDTHRDASLAVETGWAIGDRLTAAKTDAAQRFVQLVGIVAAQFGEHLAFALARQIRTRRRAGHEKAREANRCGHFRLHPFRG